MSPITARARLARASVGVLAAVALVAGPATSALADPTADPSATPTASPSVSATPSGSATPTPTVTPSPDPSPSASPSPSATPSATASPSASASATTAPAVRGLSRSALAAAAGTPVPQTAYAADFIARTLAAGGDHYVYPGGTFFDGGNTIDAIIALAASGSGSAQMNASLDYLAANVAGYAGPTFGDTYVGGTAKSVIGLVAGGRDPRSVGSGSTDLVAQLQALETPSGRFSDTGSGDYTITITQALALVALTRAGEPLSAASVQKLVDQQCADGGFRSDIDVATCVSDPDATAFAAQALLAAGSPAATAALDNLAGLQRADGGVTNDAGVANANTTAVAAQAFAAGGRDTDLAQAQAFLLTLQYGCSSPAALRGGIAFTAADRSTSTVADSDLRATPQSALALAGGSLLSAAVAGEPSTGTTALPCAAPSSTPTVTPAPTTTAGAGGGATTDPVVTAPTGALAQTGSNLLWPVAAGLVLLLLGVVAVAASRRRGVHA